MKPNKELGTVFRVIAVLAVVTFLFSIVDAYTYGGYKWSSGIAEYRFSSDFPSGYKQSVNNAANTWNNAGSSFDFD